MKTNWWRWANGAVYSTLVVVVMYSGSKSPLTVWGWLIAIAASVCAAYVSDRVWDSGHQGKVVPFDLNAPKTPEMLSEQAKHFAAALADNALLTRQVMQLRSLSSLALHACDKLAGDGHKPYCKAAALIAEKKPYMAADCTCGLVQYGIVLKVAQTLSAEHMADEKKRGGYP